MARKGGGSTQRMGPPNLSNGHANGHPPPSTLAAQIVHNASNIYARQDSAAKVTFGELVKEFLQHPSTNEPDTQLVALICVIAEAGLEGLFRDDPFAQDQQRQQGFDSIAVIQLILQQKPHLLLSVKDEDEEGTPRPPLILWLFPKLLGLLTHTTLSSLHEGVDELLALCLVVLAQYPMLWRQATAVFQLYKSSVQCMCNADPWNYYAKMILVLVAELESTNDSASPLKLSFHATVPSSSSIAEFWPESQHFVALPHDLQRAITSRLAAIYIAFNLLSVLMRPTRTKRDQSTASATFEHHHPWISDSTFVLWQHYKRWAAVSESRPFQDETTALYLQLLDTAAFPTTEPEDKLSNSSRAAQALASRLHDLLENHNTFVLSIANQIRLASLLMRLCKALSIMHTNESGIPLRRSQTNRLVLLNDLQANIALICQRPELFNTLCKDLQVCRIT